MPAHIVVRKPILEGNDSIKTILTMGYVLSFVFYAYASEFKLSKNHRAHWQEKISAPRRATSGHSLPRHDPASVVLIPPNGLTKPSRYISFRGSTRQIVHDHLLIAAI